MLGVPVCDCVCFYASAVTRVDAANITDAMPRKLLCTPARPSNAQTDLWDPEAGS